MTETIDQTIAEKRSRSLIMLDRLVESRTEMLSIYSQLANMKPLNANADVPMTLQEFCEALVDYAANAHFQLYRYFAEGKERRTRILDVADRIYPRILEITNVVLDFNDKYDCGDHCNALNELEDDLSSLGEQLADRIELEDELITAFGYQFG